MWQHNYEPVGGSLGLSAAVAAIPILEEDFGKPVFSNPTAVPWRLIHDGIAPPVKGWGHLLETP